MIKLETLELSPCHNLELRNERFESFRKRHAETIRTMSVYDAVEQDVLILAWAWSIGGWVGTEEEWIEHLIDVVTSEYDVHRVREYKRKRLDREILLDRLVEHAQRQGSGSVEYLITHAPEEYQQILTWKYVAGYTDADIGDLLGVARNTVSYWFRKCYRIVKDNYTPNG